MAVLLARSVEKTWGDRWVLRGADLRVDPTDRVGLVGANGTGKSTLMQILAGIEEEDSGEIHRGGSIAVLMQRPQLAGETVGEAADAAIAAQLMLNVVEPQSSGLGGGAFALYWDAAVGALSSHDGRETAPLAADETYWLGPDGAPVSWFDAVPGGKSVGTPGTPALLHHLHAKFGKLPLARLAAPAVRAAEAVDELERALGKPVVTSNQAMFWQALRTAGCDLPVSGFGRLLH